MKKQRTVVNCAHCEAQFKIKNSIYSNSKTKRFFCNRHCMGEYRRGITPAHNPKRRVEKRCVVCGESYWRRPSNTRKTCDKPSCRSIYHSQNSGKRVPKLQAACEYCGRVLNLSENALKRYRHHFCNKHHFWEWIRRNGRFGKSNPHWRGGRSFEPYPTGWTEHYRTAIRQRDGNCCQICGMAKAENGQNLAVHHIDGNKHNLHPDNLICLCEKAGVDCHIRKAHGKDSEYWREWLQKKIGKMTDVALVS